jgi:hypothetical protein
MTHSAQAGLEDSIASTLGMLYERKARGTTLIQVLEDYRRVKATDKVPHRGGAVSAPRQELERLRTRRAAVEQVIRSIEAYSATQPPTQAYR